MSTSLLQTCIYVLTKVSYVRRWTGEDDECLLNAVENIGRNWKAIALEVGTKNDLQCRQRYEKVVKPGIRKGKWAIEEDEKLRYAMTLDLGSWIQVAELIPGPCFTMSSEIIERTSKTISSLLYFALLDSINQTL